MAVALPWAAALSRYSLALILSCFDAVAREVSLAHAQLAGGIAIFCEILMVLN